MWFYLLMEPLLAHTTYEFDEALDKVHSQISLETVKVMAGR